ncbi:hypothetical protein ACFOQM_22150 [Paenibacillus sp. GCM10012307]|uniref:Uncharacterized protein n=1 Tax=Paenibacillus roseus TaxID=2798579 RepID=A0A934J9A5_9BACL|nr:hypothetical protein [Paenibacillus roseus]MBJ6363933.1 hypothetical protein [Paenibacillus roseus]
MISLNLKYFFKLSPLLLIMFLALGISGCQNFNNGPSDKLITYEEYSNLYRNFSTNFNPPDLTKVAIEDRIALVAIDKESSFGKRSYLTVSGQQDERVSQRRLAYENTSEKYIVFVDLIYLNKLLDNDLVYWNTNSINQYKDNALLKKFDDNILSYRNILIKITMFSEGEQNAASSDVIRKTTLSIVDFLESNQSSNP